MPPAWRQLLSGGVEPWQLVAVAAALAGAGWMLSPYSALERGARKARESKGRTPNAVGRSLGYSAGILRSPVTDPLEVLTMRAAVAHVGTSSPNYRGSRNAYFRPPRPIQPQVTWPLATQNLRVLGAQAPVQGVSILPGPGVSRTAADVLARQLEGTGG